MFRRREEPVEPEPLEREPHEPAREEGPFPRGVRFPEADIGGVISGVMRDLFNDIDAYSYKARTESDSDASERLESIVLLRARFMLGIVKPGNEEFVTDLREKLMELSAQEDGLEFAGDAVELIGEMITRSGLFGRKKKGTSYDSGEDLAAILSGGTPEP